MKAVQTRSPIHLVYEYANLNNVLVSIWVSDSPYIDSTTTPDYQLNSQAINDFASVEISELIRSKNNYIFNPDFYIKRDTAKYVLVKAVLLDDTSAQLEVKYDFLRVRDGYVTREDLPQIYKNLIPTNILDWGNQNGTITKGITDPFQGTDAYNIDNTIDGEFSLSLFDINKTGLYTYSISAKSTNSTLRLNDNNGGATFDLSTLTVTNIDSNIVSFDIHKQNNGFFLCSIVLNNVNTRIRIFSDAIGDSDLIVFNPKLTKGNLLNDGINNLILQDNKTVYNSINLTANILFDKKESKNYAYRGVDIKAAFEANSHRQSVALAVEESTSTFTKLNNTVTNQLVSLIVLDECKHTPTKVSFINRFGVIQDLVFFKKRIDNIDTNKESYKTNVLQQGNYYSHIGQNQTIRKESKRSVTLNSGFYPEEFNTVFEQLQNSLHYWIDDEPAVLDGSSFNVKTRVNDKLINYTFDFSYSNEEVNTI